MEVRAPVSVETLLDEMKRYLRFDDGDARALASFREHASSSFPAIAEEFYERVREHEEAMKVFREEEQVDRVKRSLVQWMERLCSQPKDETYFEETSKIGRVHVRIGLSQRYMFMAMALIRLAFFRIADATMGASAQNVRSSISKALDLETTIMLEAFRDASMSRLQKAEQLERERAGRAAAKNEHRYLQAIELAHVLIVGLDESGTIRLFNREAERVTELGREEVIGTSFVEALIPEALREDHGRLLDAAAHGESSALEFDSAIKTRAGKIREIRWQLAYSKTETDPEVVLFAFGMDTTDQKALAARVRQSEKLAAVGTLAAGLAHEIRNPLNGAFLHVTFLERGLKRAGITDEDTFEAVKIVGQEIKRLGTLVSEFLDFARPKPLVKKMVSLRELCERATELAAAEAASAKVEVKLDLPTSDPTLELDPPRMEQVLLNLIRNAIEAMAPGGGGVVIVRARRRARQEIIEVEDNGPGLPDPGAPIFDPFFSTKPQGTGLGLAIAHRVVTDHDGTIDVSSQPKKTIFRVTLPIHLS